MSSEDWVSESEAMQDMGIEEESQEFMDELRDAETEGSREKMIALYNDAQRAQTGATIRCPTCQALHLKTTYHKVFCSNGRTKGKGKKNCKDGYWNFADRGRCERAGLFA